MQLLNFVIFIVLCSGCAALQTKDPQAADRMRLQAESFISQNDYAEAADQFAAALRYQPQSGALYLRRGEVLERAEQIDAAKHNYVSGLKQTAPADPSRLELTHRLALLVALKKNAIDEARSFAEQLPLDSPRRHDIAGVIAFLSGNQRQALQSFNAALEKMPDHELTAAILFHAALAYHSLGDEKNVSATLYEAINRTSNLALAWEIEKFWQRSKDLKTGPR